MKDKVFYGEGMKVVKELKPELYEILAKLNDEVYSGKVLDYKTLKLVAIAIVASRCDEKATEKQMLSAIKELGITKDEIMDVLGIVLLTSGMPAYVKAMKILNKL